MLPPRLWQKKISGKDGIPIEFYLALWEDIGLILLEVLRKGLSRGVMHPKLTVEIIIMLMKKGDWPTTSCQQMRAYSSKYCP